MVHGDDFITAGGREEVKQFRRELEDRFEVKTKVVGTKEGEVQEAKVLNRIVRVTGEGWEYEPDQRHADLIVKDLSLEHARSVKTPCEEEKAADEVEYKKELIGSEATAFRGLAARVNYLALDRADLQYAAKEVCRGMAKPTLGHWKKMKRIGRYLVGRPRSITKFPWQEKVKVVQVFSDSDWAGCKRTAKSTSGGAVMRGKHNLKSWSSTQRSITLSSAEAELVAAVKASTELIGVLQMSADWDMTSEGEVMVDSSAALGVVKRQGNGRLRHIRVGMLWIQEKQSTGELVYSKVGGKRNPADLMTKSLTEEIIHQHMQRLDQQWCDGRAAVSLEIAGTVDQALIK